MSMGPRERVLKAIRHEEPDRVPLDLEIRQEVLEKLMEHVGAYSLEELYHRLGIDIIRVDIQPVPEFMNRGAFFHPRRKWVIEVSPGIFQDEWGIQYRVDRTNRYFGFHRHPLAAAKTLKEYNWLDLGDPRRYGEVVEAINRYGSNYAIMGIATLTLFEQAWQLRGYKEFVIDMYKNKAFAEELLDRLLELRIKQCRKYVELGVDIVHIGDDVGMQDRMMISPELWREFFKPRLAELIREYNTRGKVYTMYHSDGYITPIIEDLVEIGVDILNPIQPESMDPGSIKRTFGERLTLHGTISVQTTLPQGSPDEVKATVKRTIRECAPGGGLILAPTHAIQPDTSVENILAFYDSVQEYGKYPILI